LIIASGCFVCLPPAADTGDEQQSFEWSFAMPDQPDLTITETADGEAQELIERGLAGYNEEKAGYRDWCDLAILLADSHDRHVLGGLIGRTSLGLPFVGLFYLLRQFRRGGSGGQPWVTCPPCGGTGSASSRMRIRHAAHNQFPGTCPVRTRGLAGARAHPMSAAQIISDRHDKTTRGVAYGSVRRTSSHIPQQIYRRCAQSVTRKQ
jgi:hypothetical protein